jgi:N-acetylglucosamine kinase-like BadF-type ATPase
MRIYFRGFTAQSRPRVAQALWPMHSTAFPYSTNCSQSRILFWMRYFLGFDGGGTKTECVLMNSADQVLARTYAGPSNPFRIGIESAARAVDEAASLALEDAGVSRAVIVAIGAGLAGTAAPDLKEGMRAALRDAFPGAAITVLTDLEAALAAAGEGPAIVLVAGTGSAAIGRNAQNEIFRAGGYGPHASDQGSAFDIGRQAVAAAMRERQESGSDSALGRKILLQLGFDDWSALQRRAETSPDAVYPKVFPVVSAAADAGDPVACKILLDSANHLSELVAEVAAYLALREKSFSLVKTGGMFGRSSFLTAQLDASLKQLVPLARSAELRISPAEAAALAAKY